MVSTAIIGAERGSTIRIKKRKSPQQVLGDIALEKGPGHDHIVDPHRAGNDDGPVGIVEPQGADQEEAGDKAPGKEHGKGDEPHEHIPSVEVPPGKGVGQGDGEDYVDRGPQAHDVEAVDKSPGYLGGPEHRFVALQGQPHRPEPHPALGNRQAAGKGEPRKVRRPAAGPMPETASLEKPKRAKPGKPQDQS